MNRRPYPTRTLAALLGLACLTASSSLLLASSAAGATSTSGSAPCGRQAVANQDDATRRAASRVLATVTLTMTSDSTTPFGSLSSFTATVSPAPGNGTVAFTYVPSTGPQATQTIPLGTKPLVCTAAVSASYPIPSFGPVQVYATYTPTAGQPVASQPAGAEVQGYDGQVIITEFRNSAQYGAKNSYVELRNTGAAVPLDGFELQSTSGDTTALTSGYGTLATGRSFLIAGADYTLASIATMDRFTTALGTGGFRVVAPDSSDSVTDAVGPATGFHTGTPLPALAGLPADQHAWVRAEVAGKATNTRQNAADFRLVSTTGGLVGGVQSTLGSPSPTGTTSAYQHNGVLRSALLDIDEDQAAEPNREYTPGTSGMPGELIIRRTITNTSGVTITAAKMRVTALSAVNGGPEPGVTSQRISQASLRVINPAAVTSRAALAVLGNPVQPLSLGAPATGGQGGLNSTLALQLDGGLIDGDSINVEVRFAVDTPGHFWFGYDIDAQEMAPGRIGGTVEHRTADRAPDAQWPVLAPGSTVHGVL